MNEIETSDKQVGDPQKKEKVIAEILSRIPGDDENSAGDHHGEDLSDAMEKEIVVDAASIQCSEEKNA
jgi:hypothetical protein